MGPGFSCYLVPAFKLTEARYMRLYNQIEQMSRARVIELCDEIFGTEVADDAKAVSFGKHELQMAILTFMKTVDREFTVELEQDTKLFEGLRVDKDDAVWNVSVPGTDIPYWIVAGMTWGDPVAEVEDTMKLLVEDDFLPDLLAWAHEDLEAEQEEEAV